MHYFNIEKLGAIVRRYRLIFMALPHRHCMAIFPLIDFTQNGGCALKRVTSLAAGEELPKYSINETITVTYCRAGRVIHFTHSPRWR